MPQILHHFHLSEVGIAISSMENSGKASDLKTTVFEPLESLTYNIFFIIL